VCIYVIIDTFNESFDVVYCMIYTRLVASPHTYIILNVEGRDRFWM